MWKSSSESLLYKDHENGTRVTDDEVLNGTLLNPLPPYTQEMITLQLNTTDTIVYGIVVRDDENYTSGISNVVSVPSASLLAAAAASTSTTVAITATTEKSNRGLVIGLSVGLTLAAVIAVVVVAVVIKLKSAKVTPAADVGATATP